MVVILAAVAVFGREGRAAVIEDWRGIYVATRPLMGPRSTLPDAVFMQDGVSGIYIQLRWDKIEPSPGIFDFTMLDRELGRAIAHDKKVSLSVIAGGHSPMWLRREGGKLLDFKVARGGGQCLAISIAPPWDPVYQKRYSAMMTAVSAHIDRMSASAAVRIVKLTGVARITEELRLPITTGRRDECGEVDATGRWIAAGYRPDRVVNAWMALARSVANAFPNAILAQDILERNDFPDLDERGRAAADLTVKRSILAAGQRVFGRRFAVQWDGLNKVGDLPATPLAAHRAGVILGWQSNMRRGFDGAGCNLRQDGRPVACSGDDYATLLGRALESGASYIEIWPEDALRFPEAVRVADKRLRTARR
jgi:hypothetical protein